MRTYQRKWAWGHSKRRNTTGKSLFWNRHSSNPPHRHHQITIANCKWQIILENPPYCDISPSTTIIYPIQINLPGILSWLVMLCYNNYLMAEKYECTVLLLKFGWFVGGAMLIMMKNPATLTMMMNRLMMKLRVYSMFGCLVDGSSHQAPALHLTTLNIPWIRPPTHIDRILGIWWIVAIEDIIFFGNLDQTLVKTFLNINISNTNNIKKPE